MAAQPFSKGSKQTIKKRLSRVFCGFMDSYQGNSYAKAKIHSSGKRVEGFGFSVPVKEQLGEQNC